MKAGWQLFKLGDLTDLITKGTTPTSIGFDFTSNGVNFIKIESLTDNGHFIEHKLASISEKCHQALARSQIKEGDILFSIAGALGRTAIVPPNILPANTNQALAIIRLKNDERILPKFIYKALGTGFVLEQVDKFKGGVAQQNLSLAQIKDFQIPIPPIEEQQRIVAILDQAFEGIAKARANAEQNLQNARALFESHLQSVFTQRGDGWVESTLDDVCDLITCGVAATPKYVDEAEGVPFLSAQNVRDGEVVLDKFRHISKEFHRELTKKNKPVKGDVLYSRVGSKFGEAGVVEHDFEFSVYVSLTLIKPKPVILNSYFLKHYLNSAYVKSIALKSISSSGVPNLNVKGVRQFPIKLPSISQQVKFVEEINELRVETQRLEALYQRKIACLDELKKSLLQQAFAGAL